MANHCEVLGSKGGEVTAADTLTGDLVRLRPKHIVNAAGVWVDRVREHLGITGGRAVRTSRGSHVVLEPRSMDAALAFFLPDRRIQFLVPGERGLMSGTTDVDDSTDPDRITTPDEDVDDYPLDPEGVIELDQIVRDAIGVEIPFSPLHSPDCQGLCPVCGGDRNLGECPGDHPSTDPRWAGLEQLLEQMER